MISPATESARQKIALSIASGDYHAAASYSETALAVCENDRDLDSMSVFILSFDLALPRPQARERARATVITSPRGRKLRELLVDYDIGEALRRCRVLVAEG